VSASLLGVLFAQLVVGVVGVLAFSGEYGTGMIRATLAVVPARLPVLWAKLIVLAGVVLPVTLLCAVVDFFAATAIESSRGGSVISLTDPGVLRTVVGSSLYLTVVVVIGLALGACSARPRHPAPAARTTQQPRRRPATAGPHQPRARRLSPHRRGHVQ
jgi:ABC-2 type transport system permease protein